MRYSTGAGDEGCHVNYRCFDVGPFDPCWEVVDVFDCAAAGLGVPVVVVGCFVVPEEEEVGWFHCLAIGLVEGLLRVIEWVVDWEM